MMQRISIALAILAGGLASSIAHAEGSYQAGLNQPLFEYRAVVPLPEISAADHALHLDVASAGEVINLALCGVDDADPVSVVILDPTGAQVVNTTLSTVATDAGRVSCTDPMNAPLSNPLRYTTATAGTYRIELSSGNGGILRRFDVSVTPDALTSPDPRVAAGRLWSYSWVYMTGGYVSALATDADYFILVPGGRPNTHYVWRLDLNQFSGFFYEIIANALGVNPPNSGHSTEMAGNSITEEFPVYLGYPAIALSPPTVAPVISAFRFKDNANVDYGISPATTAGIQDSGTFSFTSDVNGTYAIMVDANQDGSYGSGDVLLLGRAAAGSNSVVWNGKDANGNPLPAGFYNARLELRLGEYHFIAADAETSGGGVSNGLTIYQALNGTSTSETRVFWDDQTLLGGTTTLPNGVLSGRHTWGDFTGTGFGNERYIDTYVYGLSSTATTIVAITANDDPLAPVIGLADTVTGIVDNGNGTYTVSYLVTAENLGNTPLSNLSITNDLSAAFINATLISATAANGTLLANPGYNGVTNTQLLSPSQGLALAASGTVLVNAVVDPGFFPGPHYSQATATAADPLGVTGTDLSTQGTDPDNDGGNAANDNNNDPTDNSDRTPATLPLDFDGDGVADAADLDDDNDGLPDGTENHGADPYADHDGDAVPNYLDTDYPAYADANGDTINDAFDTDRDGVLNNLDRDADNDGLADVVEAGGTDANGDGVLDGFSDTDGDGLAASVDASEGGTPLAAADFDGDGAANYQDLDSDHDGIPDVTENDGVDSNGDGLLDGFVDADRDGLADSVDGSRGGTPLTVVNTDGDALPNYLDLDSDRDGILDGVEAGATPASPQDTDADGRADYRDIDADHDGITDLIEAQAEGAYLAPSGADADGDGLDDAYDANDASADPALSAGLTPVNTDAAGTPDYRDTDADDDGLTDAVEGRDANNDRVADVLPSGSDTDGDGLDNAYDAFVGNDPVASSNAPLPDHDADALRDWRDADADNDGIPNSVEFGGDPLNPKDSDGDGVPDYRDRDADNDGTPDSVEAGADALHPSDSDGDGVADYLDRDADNDGIPDIIEAGGVDANHDGVIDGFVDADNDGLADLIDASQGGTPLAPVDTDGDGIRDAIDLDADNDGIADVVEAGGVDLNGDGRLDGFVDANGDGVDDNTAATPLPLTDTDQDSVADYKELDADNDGIPDITEAGGADANRDGKIDGFADADGDGLADSVDTTQGGTPLANGDFDADGLPNARDIDADGDGLTDAMEAGTTPAAPADTDGDGKANYLDIDADNDGIPDNIEAQSTTGYIAPTAADADGDGLADVYDAADANVDPAASAGLTPVNTDAAAPADYLDTDADNDGLLDAEESGRGSPTGTDTDGDGLDNGFDRVSGPDVNDDITTPASALRDSNGNAGSGGDVDYRERSEDLDGDGVANVLDADDDNDGIPDLLEGNGVDPSLDSDSDGTPNYRDSDAAGFVDSNGDGIDDRFDADRDGVPNHLDTDSDNDGIPDLVELGGVDANGDGRIDTFVDADGDGLADSVDPSQGGTPLTALDQDGDGLPNARDLDSDGDGISDATEAGATLSAPVNTDLDGLADYRDIDADNDGIPDNIEAQATTGYSAPTAADADGDGLADVYDAADANVDPAASAGLSPDNTDGADVPDYRDSDADDDGLSDVVEGDRGTLAGADADGDGLDNGFDRVTGYDVNDDISNPVTDLPDSDGDAAGGGDVDYRQAARDTDGDGVADITDTDDDNDGVTDTLESSGLDPNADSDGDGTPNYRDSDAAGFVDNNSDGIDDRFDADRDGVPNHLDIDADNDGIVDLIEAGGVDANGDGRIDGFTDANNDGIDDGLAASPLPRPDTDGDGLADGIDIDADADGIPDLVEAQPEGVLRVPTGNDADGDGLDNAFDADNGGTPVTPVSTDSADVPDYRDSDADNDGVSDLIEGSDANHDGVADVTPSGTDANRDGLDDAFAAATPSRSNAPLQNSDADGVRDWRDADDDGDGQATSAEDGNSNDNYRDDDADSDGVPDYLDDASKGNVRGTVYEDKDKSGNVSSGEAFTGTQVRLFSAGPDGVFNPGADDEYGTADDDSVMLATAVSTGSDGAYRFNNVAAGQAVVVTDAPAASGFVGASRIVTIVSGADTVADFRYIDPAGVIYDAVTKAPLAGATVSIYQDINGNGVHDAAVDVLAYQETTGADGAYAWPVAGAARYLIVVTPPATGNYSFPSAAIAPTVAPTPLPNTLNDNDGINTGVYYLDFTFAPTSGDLIGNDIPLDPPALGSILLRKTASKNEVSIGTMLKYTIEAVNQTAAAVNNVTIRDLLPAGFKLVDGSAYLTRAGADTQLGTPDDVSQPVIASGQRPIAFDAVSLSANETVRIEYVVRIGSGVTQGDYVNQATPYNNSAAIGNTARATVRVIGDPVFDKSLVIGKVFHDRDKDGWQDSAAATGLVLRATLDESAYMIGGLSVDYGDGPQPLAGDNANLALGIELGSLAGRGSERDAPERIVLRATFSAPPMSNLSLTSAEGSSIEWIDGRMAASHQGSVAQGLSAQALAIERSVEQRGDAYEMTVTIGNRGIDESGIPGVRIASPTGLLIETDRYGRYHLADVDGGRFERGRNVILKVDPATLPDGAAFTTENPRLLRVTPGVPAKIDFGVKLPAQAEYPPLRTLESQGEAREVITKRKVQEVKVMKVQDLVEPVRFASGRSDIRLEQVDVLRQTIESLKDKRNLRLHFIGHTDNQQLSARSRAKYGDNYGLALDRAQQVAEMFRLELGLPAHMITFEGMGADHPLESNDTSEGMALNRRVEIEIRYEDVSETETEIEERSVVPAPPTVEKVMHLEDGSTLWTTEDPYLLDPRLAVVAVDPLFVRERQVAQPVRFRLYSNYAAFIARWELAIYAGTDVDRIAPLATLSGDKLDNAGEVAWDGAPLTAKQLRDNDALSYVLRVYSADGAVDETAPRPLEITSHATGYDAAQAGKDALDKVYGANMLAKQQIKIVGSRVRIHGEGLPANRSLSINGARAVIDEQGRFAVEQVLPLGTNVLKLELVDEAGQRWTRDLAVDVAGEHFFMVGIADLTVGQNSVSGSVEPLSADDHFDEEVFADGRVAFYLKGKVRGRYLITAQLDTEEGELKDIFKDLDRKDPRVMFRQLDPDRYYPVYGDDSTVIDDTDSQGKMFVKVQWDRSHALWGNFNTGFTGNELAQYNRSLYGAKAQYRSESDTRYGDPRTEVSGFVSQPQTALAHNEFRSTGASLYYLKHTQVVQGSEKVRAEVRARDGERVLQNITLERGRDYDFDDLQGRIILLRPLTMVGAMAAPSIIKDMPLDGDQVYLVVDYEYVTSDFDTDELAYGARAKTWLDDKLALGGTYVHENRNGADHEIRGVDVTARLGRGTYLKGEYAQSEATQSQTGVLSTDGGLSFGNLDASSGITEGNAYGVEGRVNLGEMTEGARDGSAGVWVKQRDAGFANASLGKGVETREAGAEGEMKVSEDLTLAARGTVYDRDGVGKDQKLSVQAEMRAGESTKITGELGAVSESPAAGDERTATLGAVKLGHDLSDDVNIYGVLQLTLTHNDAYAQNNLATLGTKAKLTDKLGVQAEASSGSRGHAATVGMDYVFMDSHSLYTAYSSSVDRTDGHKDVLTVGQRIGLSDRTRVFHENQFSDSDRQAGVAHVFGLDFDASKTLRLGASVQSSRIDDDVSGGIERDAFTLTLQHRDLNTSISSKLEFRFDHGSDEKRQWLTTNNVRHKLSEEYTWLGKLNLSHTDDRSDARDDARFAEIGVGLAYRPIDWNRLNLIGKYTYLHDLPSEAQTPNQTDERAHVLALESLYDLDQRWTLGGKLATKRSELRADRDAGAWYTTRTHLAAANLRYHFIRNWDGLAEYRWLAVQEAEDSRHGLLLSISRHIGDHLQLGVGYNFSQFNDDLTNLDYDAQGWFINLVGSY